MFVYLTIYQRSRVDSPANPPNVLDSLVSHSNRSPHQIRTNGLLASVLLT